MPTRKPPAPPTLYDVRPITRATGKMQKAEASLASGLPARAALRAAIKAVRQHAGEGYEGIAVVPTGVSSWDFWDTMRAKCSVNRGRTEGARGRWGKLARDRNWHARGALPVACVFMNDGFKAAATTEGRKPARRSKRR